MKASNLIKVSALVIAASLAGPAAAGISTGNLATDIQSAVGSEGQVNVRLVDGVVTLTGNVTNSVAKLKAQSAAMKFEGVTEVVDHISAD